VQNSPAKPLDPPMVPFAVAGTALWLVLGLLLLPARGWLARHGHSEWFWTCVAGFLLGLVGTAMMIRHDRRRAARRATTPQ
jgi:bacteriorhodopsin